MRRLIRIAVLGWALFGASAAFAQCGSSFPGGTLCGNTGSAQGLAQPVPNPTLGRNGSVGGSLTLRGATSGSVILQVPAAAGTGTVFQLPSSNGTSGFVLQTDGSGHTSWVSVTAGGTVTSVGLSLPGIFTVTGSPVTTSGTLTGSLANQSANLVWAGPTTGAAAAPTFRALVGADLPNPTTSSLGGIQAVNAVTHQWINSINGSGVPQLSQPSFTDISGSISPGQCPNPSASTIGCVQSFAAQTSKWINTISTSGVPSATQPNFTDIAGSATLSQLPSISNLSVLGNNSGGTAIPSALSASQVLDMIGATQGQVLYRNASNWTILAPGTNGQVLTTGGAAANPSWTTVTGTGTVTSIATNNGITGGTITTTGTIGLATIATGNVLAYTGAGSGVPVATTPSAVLDVIGSTTGNILYRAAGGTGWQVLAPGTNGQVLTMGASTPAWGSAGSVSNVTISAGAGLSASGTCNITTTGTCTLSAALPRFEGYLSANQSPVTDSTFTLVNLDTVVVDSNSWFNASTHLYTPLVSGFYWVTVKIRCAGSTSVSSCTADIRKNGSSFARSGQFVPSGIAAADGSVTALVSVNGSTDTISAYGFIVGTGTESFTGGSAPILTYMAIHYVGP